VYAQAGKGDKGSRGRSPTLNMEVQELALAIFFRIDFKSSQEIKASLAKANNLNVFRDRSALFYQWGEANMRDRIGFQPFSLLKKFTKNKTEPVPNRVTSKSRVWVSI